MKVLNLVTLLLVIVGGVNWGLVGAFGFDLVVTIFGPMSALSRIVYVLVGVSALWQLMPLTRMLSGTEMANKKARSANKAGRPKGCPAFETQSK